MGNENGKPEPVGELLALFQASKELKQQVL
jgi:hypothetical protein